MKFWLMVLAAAVGQIITFILVEGFKQSYWGKNCVQELTRIWNSFCKHYKKMQDNNDPNKDL
jgi:hypothetical protein